MRHRIEIVDLSLFIHLGCTAEERTHPQEVRVSLSLDFLSPPAGCQTDSLKDTVCYAAICGAIREKIDGSEHALVEHVAQEIYQTTETVVAGKASIRIRLHKVRPPIPHLLGGVFYELGL